MSNQTINNNLKYQIDPTFIEVNRLFALSFEIEGDRTSFQIAIIKCWNKRLQCSDWWKKTFLTLV